MTYYFKQRRHFFTVKRQKKQYGRQNWYLMCINKILDLILNNYYIELNKYFFN